MQYETFYFCHIPTDSKATIFLILLLKVVNLDINDNLKPVIKFIKGILIDCLL